VGRWSDENLYIGSMEAADIIFRSDGTGWTYWSRDGGSFYVRRFNWQITPEGRLDLRFGRQLSGRWTLHGSEIHHQVESQRTDDITLSVSYAITTGQDVLGNAATLLEFDQRLFLGTIGQRFALKTDDAHGEDPTISAEKA
jgi:hypothetical protein